MVGHGTMWNHVRTVACGVAAAMFIIGVTKN